MEKHICTVSKLQQGVFIRTCQIGMMPFDTLNQCIRKWKATQDADMVTCRKQSCH